MSRNAWMITEDLTVEPGEDNAVGTVGPPGAPLELLEELRNGKGMTWRALDDDGELYYRGRMIVPEDAQEFELNSPLRDYAVVMGCVVMEYLDSGKWRAIEC